MLGYRQFKGEKKQGKVRWDETLLVASRGCRIREATRRVSKFFLLAPSLFGYTERPDIEGATERTISNERESRPFALRSPHPTAPSPPTNLVSNAAATFSASLFEIHDLRDERRDPHGLVCVRARVCVLGYTERARWRNAYPLMPQRQTLKPRGVVRWISLVLIIDWIQREIYQLQQRQQ